MDLSNTQKALSNMKLIKYRGFSETDGQIERVFALVPFENKGKASEPSINKVADCFYTMKVYRTNGDDYTPKSATGSYKLVCKFHEDGASVSSSIFALLEETKSIKTPFLNFPYESAYSAQIASSCRNQSETKRIIEPATMEQLALFWHTSAGNFPSNATLPEICHLLANCLYAYSIMPSDVNKYIFYPTKQTLSQLGKTSQQFWELSPIIFHTPCSTFNGTLTQALAKISIDLYLTKEISLRRVHPIEVENFSFGTFYKCVLTPKDKLLESLLPKSASILLDLFKELLDDISVSAETILQSNLNLEQHNNEKRLFDKYINFLEEIGGFKHENDIKIFENRLSRERQYLVRSLTLF